MNEISYANLVMYSSTIPSYRDSKGKGTWKSEKSEAKTEKFSGFASFMKRMKEIKAKADEK